MAAGVPELFGRGIGTTRYGTSCSVAPGTCAPVPTAECTVTIADSGTNCANAALAGAIVANMRLITPLAMRTGNAGTVVFTYSDPNAITPRLGFVGGPYIPMVTVEVRGAAFQFLALAPLARLLGGAAFEDILPMPTMRSTAVGEDLNLGDNG
jgi:hypothetical protein